MGHILSRLVRKSKSFKTRSSPLPRECRPPSISQSSSNAGLFDRLPLEIRHMIYVYALGGDILYLIQTATSLGYHACQWSHPYSMHCHTVGEFNPRNRLCLLETCRQIYTEASPVLYSTNTFGILGANNLPVFCEFSRSIRKARLDSITSIYINCQADAVGDIFLRNWTQTWEILATRMPGLKHVRVRLLKHFPPLELALEERWVKPMLEVGGLKRLEFDLAQEIGSGESTADYNERLEWFQNKLQALMCSSR